MSWQTTADNLADLVREMGGDPRGTTSQLVDQLEHLVGVVPPGQIEQGIEDYLEDPDHTGALSDDELDEVFDGA